MICSICGQLLEDCEQTDLCKEANCIEDDDCDCDLPDSVIDPDLGDK